MALSFSRVLTAKIDQQNLTVTNVTLDDAYPAGGEAITPNQLGLSTASVVVPLGNPGGATFAWDPDNSKLLAFYADYSTPTDGLLIDIAVGDTAILDGVVVPVMAIGI